MSATSIKAREVPKIPVGTRKNWAFDDVETADDHHHQYSHNCSAQVMGPATRNPSYGWKREAPNKSSPGLATLFKPVFSGKASLEGRNVALGRNPIESRRRNNINISDVNAAEDMGLMVNQCPLETLVPLIYKHEVVRKQKTEKDLSSLVLEKPSVARNRQQQQQRTAGVASRGGEGASRRGQQESRGGVARCDSTESNLSSSSECGVTAGVVTALVVPPMHEARPPHVRSPMTDDFIDSVLADLSPTAHRSPAGNMSPAACRSRAMSIGDHSIGSIGSIGSVGSGRSGRDRKTHSPRVHKIDTNAMQQFQHSVLEVSPIKTLTAVSAAAATGRLRSDSMTSVASIDSVASNVSGISGISQYSTMSHNRSRQHHYYGLNRIEGDESTMPGTMTTLNNNSQITEQIYQHYISARQQVDASCMTAQIYNKSPDNQAIKKYVCRESKSVPILNKISQMAPLTASGMIKTHSQSHGNSNGNRNRKRDHGGKRNSNHQHQQCKNLRLVPVHESDIGSSERTVELEKAATAASAAADYPSDIWAYRPLVSNDSAPWVVDRCHIHTITEFTGENICQQLQMNHLPVLKQCDELLSPYSSNSVLHSSSNNTIGNTGYGHDMRTVGSKSAVTNASVIGDGVEDGCSIGSNISADSDNHERRAVSGSSITGGSMTSAAATTTTAARIAIGRSKTSSDGSSGAAVNRARDWEERKYILKYCPYDSSAVAKTINFQTKKVKPMFEKFSSDCRLSKLNLASTAEH